MSKRPRGVKLRREREGRMFFLERKNQRTFVTSTARVGPARHTGPDARAQKFFAAFFQIKKTFLFSCLFQGEINA
jgi:ribosomal protein S18